MATVHLQIAHPMAGCGVLRRFAKAVDEHMQGGETRPELMMSVSRIFGALRLPHLIALGAVLVLVGGGLPSSWYGLLVTRH